MSEQQPIFRVKSMFRILRTCLVVLLFSSCYTSKLKEGEYLLDKNKIIVDSKSIDEEQLEAIIKQKPNKKIFGILKFHLLLHNTMNEEKVAERKKKKLEKKNKRIAKKNKRREKKGKEPLYNKTLNDFTTFGEKLLYGIGDPPVILDTAETKRSSKQMNIYLIKKGYFNNTVKDSVVYIDKRFFKKKRSKVYYKVKLNEPYKIRSLAYTSKDTNLMQVLKPEIEVSKIKEGHVFDVTKLENERNRITNYLLNKGYYQFNKSYINYVVDSNISGKLVDVTLRLDKYLDKKNKEKTVEHKVFKLTKVNINYTQNELAVNGEEYTYQGVDFYLKGKKDIRTSLLYRLLYLLPGDVYSKQKEQQTFRNFTGLGLFKNVNIKTELLPTSTTGDELVMNIYVRANKKQEIRLDANLTNTGGSNFGVEGNSFYNHKNVFKGAEEFSIGFSGKLEYQPLAIGDNSGTNSNAPVNAQSFTNISNAFNTVEFGPEISIAVPRLLFFNSFQRLKRISNMKTKVKASLNYQRRINVNVLDYERAIQELSYSYSWNIGKKTAHLLEPISINAIEVVKSQEFEDRINNSNDKLLAASFQSHLISSTRYRFVYNELLGTTKKRSNKYYSGSIEAAGNILRGISLLTNRPADPIDNSYEFLGVKFAQYIKTTQDVRWYYDVSDKSSFVSRVHGGIGVPLKNLDDALPFIKSYFAGGTDKNRAWKARSLGPGSFRDSVLSFDKIGEVMLEGNIEYRFDLLGFLDGAFFVDAGNIWLMNDDSLRGGSQFQVDQFYKDIAIGAGFGLRIDLDFFLFRFDVGFPLKNPSLVEGERWFFQRDRPEYKTYLQTLSSLSNAPSVFAPQFNIGIGYPF